MNKPEHEISIVTNEYPTGLKTAEETAAIFDGISGDRLRELADSGYAPHYRIDGGPALFKPQEVKRWITQNLMAKCDGKALPSAIRVVIPAHEIFDKPPSSIWNVPNLQQMPKHGYQPGIYFLCKGEDVVYVGQSVTPSSRIATHSQDANKDFDRVYLLPVPESELNNVEAAFIHHIKPAQQGGIREGKEKPRSPAMTAPKDDILKSVGFAG